jgi:hypothetical protein
MKRKGIQPFILLIFLIPSLTCVGIAVLDALLANRENGVFSAADISREETISHKSTRKTPEIWATTSSEFSPINTPRYISSRNPCPISDTHKAMGDFGKQMQLFSDVTHAAETTPKIFLQDKIFEMQEIKENTVSIPISQCMETLREYVLNGQQKTIDMYLFFVGGGSDEDIRSKRDEANGWFDIADREVDNILRDPAGLKTGYK